MKSSRRIHFFFPNLNFKKCLTKHPKLRLSEICLCDSTFPTLSCGKLTNRNAPLVNKVSVQTRYLWSWALGPKSSAPYQQSPPYTSGHGYSNNNRGLTSPVVVVLLYIYTASSNMLPCFVMDHSRSGSILNVTGDIGRERKKWRDSI